MMGGYVTCGHRDCFQVIVGNVGDLCPDCSELDPERDSLECCACDHD